MSAAGATRGVRGVRWTSGRLAVRTVRARAGAYLAPAVVALAGTALLTAFAGLLATGRAAHGQNASTLLGMASILGGWTVAIVAYGVVSAVALTVRARGREIALLRLVAATPRQVRRTVVAETLVATIPGIVLGLLPGLPLGALLLDRLLALGAVQEPLRYRTDGWAVGLAAATSLLAAWVGALAASRRASRIAPIAALGSADGAPASRGGDGRLAKGRRNAGIGALLLAAALGGTATGMPVQGSGVTATAGPACVVAALGLGLLAAPAVAALGRLLGRLPGAAVRLAGRSLAARAAQAAASVGPLVLLVGVAVGTLGMQMIEDAGSAGGAGGGPAAQIASANYLVVAMIVGFSVIAAANTLIAAVRDRAAEFALLRLTGATRRQVLASVAVEAGATGALAAVLGLAAAVATVVPYAVAKAGTALPGDAAAAVGALAAGVAVAAVALAVGVGVGTARRVAR
ncbi:hypothetical protein BIV57_18195 [Mangrovactinospora gilvigrisea]|uniref:ABC3 transporter permease C-terminal domain-containing protein n=1 Tax=Mangrovactinospora gilvigrisea TaxID=1428644 RepID=A0A1J7BBR3_9ACTN|nr:FtsX-like permease family protein [Mangrovactinospora gilvigrisea]OIV36091.1 hypothetical protein BIV57_18195 [Mangrovactinospora gilvigrisea]